LFANSSKFSTDGNQLTVQKFLLLFLKSLEKVYQSISWVMSIWQWVVALCAAPDRVLSH